MMKEKHAAMGSFHSGVFIFMQRKLDVRRLFVCVLILSRHRCAGTVNLLRPGELQHFGAFL